MRAVAWSADLLALARAHGPRCAVSNGRESLTFADLSARAHGLAAHLRSLGLAAGEPVASSLPNGPQAVWVSYGLLVHGAAEAPMHAGMTQEEVAWFAALTGIRHVIAPRARQRFFEHLGLALIAVEDLPTDGPAPLPPVPGEARGRYLQSSGTTGKPKGLLYTHERRARGNALLKSTLPFPPAPGDTVLLMTPFPHGASLLTYAWLDFGGEVVLLDGVKKDEVSAALARGLSAVFAPPTVINKLADLFPGERFPTVRCVFTGTQTLTEATYRRAERMFGPVVRVTYGKTECVNPITVLAPADTAAVYAGEARADGACLGWPAEGVELEIRDGQIWLRARHMSSGWIDAEGFHAYPDGWHATGDAGWIDDRGRLWLAGRLADVIKSGGYKVQPEEIEGVLAGLPDCGQIVVTSLPSDYWGEVIVAATEQAQTGWEKAGMAAVQALSRHKQPRAWVALEALPRNPQGKVNRRDVRAAILAAHALEDGPHPRLRPR